MDDIFLKRRSVRRFSKKSIELETLNALLEAARMAPSWGNLQCWELVVVQDEKIKKELAALLSKKNPATLCTEAAPAVLAVCGNPLKSGYYKEHQVTRYQHWFLYDLGIISQNICLKATQLGMGSVIVGSFDHEAAERLLNIPAGYELVSLIPVGYPDHEPKAPKRRELKDFIHFDSFRTT